MESLSYVVIIVIANEGGGGKWKDYHS